MVMQGVDYNKDDNEPGGIGKYSHLFTNPRRPTLICASFKRDETARYITFASSTFSAHACCQGIGPHCDAIPMKIDHYGF